ncbi:uncharacterized protein [Onthophagus taurus]|uniref:uncharacterized protein n=1 Tax=Onthophagus taurus TaxID=166361 RepID=UPI0039BDB3A9
MADDERATLDFTEILTTTNRKFEIIHAKWIEEKHFEVKFRTQIPRNSEDFNALCDDWVDLFSSITNTVWVKKVSNTGPKIRFRKQYQCWTHGGKIVQKELLFDARRCKGTVDMKVLTDNPQTRKKNKHTKLGLNVVIKINFMHLHQVNKTEKFSCFVHNCDPQPEAPKPTILPNEKLPKLIADMVQKGLDSTSKPINNHTTSNSLHESSVIHHPNNQGVSVHREPSDIIHVHQDQLIEHGQLEIQNLEPTFQLNHLVPLQNMDSIKLEVPHYQQVTQVLVSDSDIGEQILLCQPTIMLDPSQVIPVSGHSLQSHFLQINSGNIHHNQHGYL